MKGARPLTSEETVAIKTAFRGKMAKRNLALFLLGANTGFRVSEILSLRIGDLVGDDGKIKTRIAVQRRNMKGKKASRSVKLNKLGKLGISPWLADLARRGFIHRDDFIFQGLRNGNKPISRRHAYRVLVGAYTKAGITGKLGTHAMRKTFANNVYNFFLGQVADGVPVDAFRATSKALGHSDIKSTDQYLSFLTEDIDEAIDMVGV